MALLLTLIIVATSGMPLYAKETGDKANSFRYENGQSIAKAVPFYAFSECLEEDNMESIIAAMEA